MILSNVKKIEDLDKALAEIDKAIETLRNSTAKDFLEDMQTELKKPESS